MQEIPRICLATFPFFSERTELAQIRSSHQSSSKWRG